MGNAAKVGGLVLLFVALLATLVLLFGGRLGKSDLYYAEFADVGGVTVGTAVRLAGVDVGRVREVGLKDPRTARLVLEVNERTPVPINTKAVIPTSIVGFGQTVVMLMPPERTRGYLAPGSTLEGVRPGALEGILPNAQGTVDAVTGVMREVRLLLADPKLRQNVNNVLVSLNGTLKEVERITARTNALIARTQPDLVATVRAGRGAAENVQSLTGDPQLRRDLHTLSSQFVTLSRRADHILASVDSTVNDPQMRRDLKATVSEIRQLTEKGNAIAANFTEMSETGKGVAKNAERITANMAEITEGSKTLPARVGELAESAKRISARLEGILGRLGPRTRKPGDPAVVVVDNGLPLSTNVQLDLLRTSRPNFIRADATLEVPVDRNRVIVGAYNAFERPGLILQYGMPFSGGQGRLGFYAGKPGVGVDYPLARNLELRADLWDINHPQLDARLRFGIGKGFHGWVGADRIFSEPAFTFGVGFRR